MNLVCNNIFEGDFQVYGQSVELFDILWSLNGLTDFLRNEVQPSLSTTSFVSPLWWSGSKGKNSLVLERKYMFFY